MLYLKYEIANSSYLMELPSLITRFQTQQGSGKNTGQVEDGVHSAVSGSRLGFALRAER